MDLLLAMRDLGVADPAADSSGEATVRAALAREIDKATVTGRPNRPRSSRRSRRWMRLTIPALAVAAAAAAAIVVATGAVGGSHTSQKTGSGGSLVHARDTAYVVRRVLARLAVPSQSLVLEALDTTTHGNGTAAGDTDVLWSYADPQSGVLYSLDKQTSPSGAIVGTEEVVVDTPIGEGRVHFQYTDLAPAQHIYAVRSNVGAKPPGIPSVQQIRQELKSGKATADGTATVDGQSVIKLTFPSGPYTDLLYVNSQTYEPVQGDIVGPQNVHDPSAGTTTETANYLPATAANIANAKLAQIPTGDTQVSSATLRKEVS